MTEATGTHLTRMRLAVVLVRRVTLSSVLCLLAVGWTAFAMTVSVSEFEFAGPPGSDVDDTFVVWNDESRDVSFDVGVVDWVDTVYGVTELADPGTQTRSCSTWIHLDTTSGRLSPGSESEIAFSVSIPEDVSGTYWAGLLVETAASETEHRGDVTLSRHFLVRVFITVPPADAQGRVTGVRPRGLAPLWVEIDFSNTGNTRLKGVVGLVVVETSSGDVLCELPMAAFDVLPGETVLRIVSSDLSLHQTGLYAIRAVLDFGGEYLVAGQSVVHVDALRLAPIGNSELPPTDPDADGRYEDVNGDGVVSLDDVDALARAIGASTVQGNRRAFDFDNDGIAASSDVDALRQIVLRALD